jgi:hypothetical protein
MERESIMTTFTVIKEPGYGYIVADASIKAKSFAMIPAHYQAVFYRPVCGRGVSHKQSNCG